MHNFDDVLKVVKKQISDIKKKHPDWSISIFIEKDEVKITIKPDVSVENSTKSDR